MDNCTRHATEYRLNHVQKLCSSGKWGCLNKRPVLGFSGRIVLLDVLPETL